MGTRLDGYLSIIHMYTFYNNEIIFKKNRTTCSLSQSGGELVKTAAAPLPRATSLMAPVSVARSITAEGLKE